MNAIDTSQSTRALANSTVAFTVCFAVWTIFSVIGLQIRQDLHLSVTQLAEVLLYTGTFGSFIGYSAGLPILIKILFPTMNPTQVALS